MTPPLPPIVIQAGGKGERMRAGGEVTPKVLTQVHGIPLLERLIRQVSAEGATDIYIITGYEAEQVESHVSGMRDDAPTTKIRFIREETPRGNVGALSTLAELGSPILFAFGDLLTQLEFRTLYQTHLDRGAAITAASHFERHRLTLGHLVTQGERVIDYREKPEYEFLICSGIMAISPEVLQLLPKQGTVGMNQLVMLAVDAGLLVTHWNHNAPWMDVNTPELLAIAHEKTWEGAHRASV
jgi:NDP-sugar pyrophosphorylase family protein